MVCIDGKWLREFDVALQAYLAINRHDAGITDEIAIRYADLPAREAALAFGEDYELQRVDIDRLSRIVSDALFASAGHRC